MSSPLASADFVRLLTKELREVAENKYDSLPKMREKFYRVVNSDSKWEEYYGIGGLGDVPVFNGALSYKGIDPQFHTKIENKEYALGVQSERTLIDDKKYDVLNNTAESLMTSAHRTQSKIEVRPFANAFSTAFDFMTSEENVALCSDSHTNKSGTSTTVGFDNAGSSAMNKTSVAATRLAMRLFRDNISERIEVGDDLCIVCPDALADTAEEIVGTIKGLDSADENVNPQYGRHKIIPWMRLDDSSTTNWFMVWDSQMKKDLIWQERVSPELKNTVDFETWMLKHSVYFRCSNGFIDWRWIYGHNVS